MQARRLTPVRKKKSPWSELVFLKVPTRRTHAWNIAVVGIEIKSINIASIHSSSEIFQGKLIYIIISKHKMFEIKL